MADHSPARRALAPTGGARRAVATGGARRAVATGGARRALAVVSALAAVVLAGCGTPAPTTPPDGDGSGTPTQAASSPGAGSQEPGSASPATAPGRSVTAANLLTTEEIYLDPAYQTAVETPEGVGRTTNESYVCLPDDGLASLGATAMVTRNFGYEVTDSELDPYPKSPLKKQPIIYTQALQFPDAAAATAARETYAGWIKACPNTLVEKGYSVDTGQSLQEKAIRVDGGKADAGMGHQRRAALLGERRSHPDQGPTDVHRQPELGRGQPRHLRRQRRRLHQPPADPDRGEWHRPRQVGLRSGG